MIASIDYYRIIDELKVFKNLNFKVAIARLEELKTKIPDEIAGMGKLPLCQFAHHPMSASSGAGVALNLGSN